MPQNRRPVTELVPEFIERAHGAPTPDAFRELALDLLAEVIPHDSALFIHGAGAISRDGDPRFPRRFMQRHALYAKDLALAAEASRPSGAFIDSDVYTAEQRDALPFYTDIIRPQQISSWLGLAVRAYGSLTGTIHLRRHGNGRAFSEADLATARGLHPLISLLHAAAVAHAPTVPRDEVRIEQSRLTEGELEIVRLVAQGLSNAQIALALGVSPNTIRNRLVTIFGKVHAQSRVDVARWAQTTGVVGALPTV